MRKPQSRQWWETEREIILLEAHKPARDRFVGFDSYVPMQARLAREDGFLDIARSLEELIHD